MKLHKYNHSEGSGRHCFNECVSIINEEKFSDKPQSVDPVIRSLTIFLNDSLTYHNRQKWLSPFLYRVIGTKSCRSIEKLRLEMLIKKFKELKIDDNITISRNLDFLDVNATCIMILRERHFPNCDLKPLLGLLDKMIKLTEIKETVPERRELDYQNIR